MNAHVTRRKLFLKTLDAPLTVGFTAAADFSSSTAREYLAGIMQATSDYGMHFINMAQAVRHSVLADAQFLPQFITRTQFMRAPLLDGLISWASSLEAYLERKKIRALFASLAPLPLVDIGSQDIPGVPSVRTDNAQAMRLVIDHLVNTHGFTHLAFVGSQTAAHVQRMTYFKDEIITHGIPYNQNAIFMADTPNSADVTVQVEKLLERCVIVGSSPTMTNRQSPTMTNRQSTAIKNRQSAGMALDAIITPGDDIAAHVIDALEKHGISVPDDVVVTGFTNQCATDADRLPLTTIDHAPFARGYRAVELLIDRIMHPDAPPVSQTVPASLVVRQSCRCFECAVRNALHGAEQPTALPPQNASRADLRQYLENALAPALPREEKTTAGTLAEAILADIYDTNVPPPVNFWPNSARYLKNGTPRRSAHTTGTTVFLPYAPPRSRLCRTTKNGCCA